MLEAEIVPERERLLHHAAATIGLLLTAFALPAAALPGALDASGATLAFALGLAVHLGGHIASAVLPRAWPAAATIAGGLVATWALLDGGSASLVPIGFLVLGSVPTAALTLLSGAVSLLTLVAGATASAALLLLGFGGATGASMAIGSLCAWLVFALTGAWVRLSFPRTATAIAELGRAHEAERYASELETQRRQGARLLHDTVLATLTLLAHSGVGVPAEALRAQAASDAKLLRQLREGGSTAIPGERAAAAAAPDEAAREASRGIAAVIERFRGLGLEITVLGDTRPQLRRASLDAFLLALAESLENVRRHSGVDEASLTLKEDERSLRALVSDAGEGFHLDHVDADHLGVKESMQARLREVGGSARLFSAPGSGTTVVLEVPR